MKTWYFILALWCVSAGCLFSQTDQKAPFNEAFWNGYADRLQLGPKEREEFISSHRRLNSQISPALPTATPQPEPAGTAGRGIGSGTVFAGPCVNADFETGNLSGWVRSCGWHPGFNPLGCCPNPNGQQTIMSGAGTDPFGGFPVVCPGGLYSLRLGNSATGGEADRIEQTFLVSATNANFSYKYAVVLQDPNHPANQQPFFQVELLDTTGAQVPCTFYYVAAGAGIPGFFNSSTSGVIYKPWTTVLVDLTPYLGQNITIRFSTYDCSLGGHFGYAYIDGVCQSFSGGGIDTVCTGAPATFCAPAGVSSYTWSGPGGYSNTGQCASPTAAGIYTVATTLVTGCQGPSFTYTLVNQPPPVPNAGNDTIVCANNRVVNIAGSITGFSSTPVWSSSGSGVFTSTNNISTTYTPSAADVSAGTVTISLTTVGNGVCPAVTDKMVVTITPSPVVNAGTGGSNCDGNPFALNGSVTGGATTGSWTTSGDGSFLPSASVLNASYAPGSGDIAAGGTVTLTLTSTNNGNCFPNSDTVLIRVKHPAVANAGTNQFLCSTTPTVALSGTVSGGSSTGAWSGSGAGAFTPTTTSMNTVYHITTADITAGQVIFTLTSTNNGPCAAVTDTVKIRITTPATVSAGTNQFLCSTAGSINLSGSVSGFATSGSWTSSGAGAFNPGATFLNTSYSITAADVAAGAIIFTLTSTGNGPCAAVNDTVKMRVRIPATVSAGANQALCSNASSVSLSGTIGGGSSTGIWSASGTGAFAPSNTTLNTSYAINAADVSAGAIVFTLTSTGNGPCAAVQDTVKMPVIHIATLTAGSNQYVCSNPGVITLSGGITSPSNTVSWGDNGAGILSSNNTINPTYSLAAADITLGAVIFTISSTNNGPCPIVSDTVEVAIKKLAIINAGLNQNLCSITPTINLSGTIGGGATTVVWTDSGAGVFSPNTSSLNTIYATTANDINSGSVIFTLTSTSNGPCPAVSDTVMMTITKIATVTAGPNLFVCSSSGTLDLGGTVNSPSNTATWTSNGSGVFVPNANAANDTYSFSAADVAAGTVVFTLTSTNNGVCPAVEDTVTMRFMKLAAVSAGTSQALCSNVGTLALSGAITGATGTGLWSTDGAGTFVPGSSALSTTYSFTPIDINNGLVNFTLTSTNNGPCAAVSSTASLAISKIATVSAGPNQYICSSQHSITLNGSVTGATSTGDWASSGTGTFSPTNAALGGTYLIAATDINNGTVTLTLTSTNTGVCPAVSDTVQMRIMKQATVNAGTSQVLCSNIGTLALSGGIAGAMGTGLWSTDGAGTFVPGSSALNTTYSFTPIDINNGLVNFTLTSTNNGPCAAVTSTASLAISKIATVSAGPNQYVCSSQHSIALNGSVAGVTSTGHWATSGLGPFSPTNTALGGAYLITGGDINNGTVTFTLTSTNNSVCPAVSDTVRMRIMKQATVNAGPNQALCSTAGTIALHGSINGANGTANWTASGAGAFTPASNVLVTTYSILPADISNGHVTFTMTSTNNGPCPIIVDTVNVTIRTIASVSAGINQYICSSQNTIALSGALGGGVSNGQWSSSGTGAFLQGNSALSPTYSLTPIDVINGTVTFTLISTNNGVCPAISDTVKMRIKRLASVSAGNNQLICSAQGSVNLSGTVNGGGNSGSWTSAGSGTFNPSAGFLNVSYVLTAQEISSGQATFTLSSQNSTPCPEVTDTVTVEIRTPANVVAGPSQTVCSNVSSINLSGSVTGGLGMVLWSSGGSGIFNPGTSNPVTSYLLSPGDITNGVVNFTLISTNNGPCPQSVSNLSVAIKQKAQVDAGPDRSICSTQQQLSLQGLISGVTTTGSWSSSGTGAFGTNAPAGNYSVSQSDISQGNLQFVLTSSNNDICPAVSDTMKVSIVTNPIIAMQPDTSFCGKQISITLNPTVTAGTDLQWTSTGTGTFLPSSIQAATHYNISAGDVALQNITLQFGLPAGGPCGNSAGATVQIHLLPRPHAAFSAAAYTINLPGGPVQMTNQSSGASTYTWTFGDGSGSTVDDPVHNFNTTGFYDVVLIAKSSAGCLDTTKQVITVVSDVKFPTAFTPNPQGGSGGTYNVTSLTNDVFFPYASGVLDYDMMIFNRWGELIFHSRDIAIGWDGYFNGKLCQQDAYVWKVNMTFFDGRKYNKTGSITLLR